MKESDFINEFFGSDIKKYIPSAIFGVAGVFAFVWAFAIIVSLLN